MEYAKDNMKSIQEPRVLIATDSQASMEARVVYTKVYGCS